MSCKYCSIAKDMFKPLNDTVDYSGIEISINPKGMLRSRYFKMGNSETFESQDIINIKYCPMCGEKLNKIDKEDSSNICVELHFPENVTRLIGYEKGQETFYKQVYLKYNTSNIDRPITIVFPNQIEDVSGSFIQSFFAYFKQSYGLKWIEKNITIKARNEDLEKSIKQRIM